METTLLRRVLRKPLRGSLRQVRHVRPVPPARARGLVAEVYTRSEREFGMLAPPVALHSPAPEILAACWMMLRETLLTGGGPGRAVREAVATGVSLGNACPYCAGVHGAALGGLVPPEGGARRDLAPVEEWARASGTRGRATPFPGEQAAEPVGVLVGVAVTFHYLNRMVNVFLDETPLPPRTPGMARGTLMRTLGRLMRPTGGGVEPGGSLDLLPMAPLPGDLSWAAGAPGVAGAFARAASAIEAAGRRSVPGPVRDLLTARLAAWDGGHPGLGGAWAEEAVADLAAEDRPAGRLALLTAFASYRVGEADVDAFRESRGTGDRELVELTGWASMAAARTVGGWTRGESP
ncbi:carboxymuconolactone decarboxylase family protein [Streptosporangium sp. NPDC020145]|uniref:carboxymuconolactone decarboxylase family protein n=1 Tax=Streptosporangium sp. NPDC020145 TaxID=3154694 RepID=UPI0034361D91